MCRDQPLLWGRQLTVDVGKIADDVGEIAVDVEGPTVDVVKASDR